MEPKSDGILVVCKDTGAANTMCAFLKDTHISFQSLCVGRAAEVFKKSGIAPTIEVRDDLSHSEVEGIFDRLRPRAVLLGTSLDSWTERFCCLEARKRNVFCLGFVDWWSNFAFRFSTPYTADLQYLPDAIAVTDEDARLGCIAEGVPKALLHITGNPYWDYLIAEAPGISLLRAQMREKLGIRDGTLAALIVSSNIRNLRLNLGYDERTFLESIIPLPEHNRHGSRIRWLFKPHPREDPTDMKNMLKEYRIDAVVLGDLSAIEAIATSDRVIGMCSSALFEAALLGKKVVSLQPNLTSEKLGFLRIFDRLNIPKIVDPSDARRVVEELIDDELSYPDLRAMPPTICNGKAGSALWSLLLAGMGGG